MKLIEAWFVLGFLTVILNIILDKKLKVKDFSVYTLVIIGGLISFLVFLFVLYDSNKHKTIFDFNNKNKE